MNNIQPFEGKLPTKQEQYGIENIQQVLEQLEVSKPAYENAIHEIGKGNLNNLDFLKDTERTLVDFREVVTTLGRGTVEDATATKEISRRLGELRDAMRESEEKKAKLA